MRMAPVPSAGRVCQLANRSSANWHSPRQEGGSGVPSPLAAGFSGPAAAEPRRDAGSGQLALRVVANWQIRDGEAPRRGRRGVRG